MRSIFLVTLLTYTFVSGFKLEESRGVDGNVREDTLWNLMQDKLPNTKPVPNANVQPRHIHLSRKFALNTMTVTWSTVDLPDHNFVQFGSQETILNQISQATTQLFTSRSGSMSTNQYVHEVTMLDLDPGQHYYYRCVSLHGLDNSTLTSSVHHFRVSLDGTDWSPNFIIYGDLGLENPVALPYMEQEVESGEYDAVFHIGDIAYEMNVNGGELGDQFMDLIENIATKLPYQVCAGNHDVDLYDDYNDYSKRFHMPGSFDSLFYSWDIGPIHFVSINSEYYYYGKHMIEQQYNWLVQDLTEANKIRDTVPWIIVYGHTPMYCTWNSNEWCAHVENPLRVGCPNNVCHGLEDLFYEHGVDLQIWGHMHSYEVSYPVYNNKIYNGSLDDPYRNPQAPVHIITGAPGNKHRTDVNMTIPLPEWSRMRNIDYSYSRMKVINKTHLLWEQVAVAPPSKSFQSDVIDSFTLIKETHGPYPPITKDPDTDQFRLLGVF